MRLVACTPVLNEEDYIWYVLKSIYDVVDLHIIIEGSYFWANRYDKKTGCSVDKTSEIIQTFISDEDPEKKIIYDKVGHLSKKEYVREKYIKYLKPGDLYFFVDADCVWKPEDVYHVRTFIEESKGEILGVFGNHLMFWQDFWHLLESSTPVAPWMPMVIWHENFSLSNIGMPYDKSGQQCVDLPYIKNRAVDLHFDCYHYGWVRMKEKYMERRIQTLKRSRDCSMNPKWDYLRSMNDEELEGEAFFQGKMFTDEYALDEVVVPFTGTHSMVMKKHPWYKMLRKDFDY